MSLDFELEHRETSVGTGKVVVHGLSLEGFAHLVRTYTQDLEMIVALVDKVTQGKFDLTEQQFDQLVISFTEEAPIFVASVIATAAGETSAAAVEKCKSIPFAVQIKILRDISDLTFKDLGGIKKAMEMVADLLRKTPEAIADPIIQKVE